MEGDVRVPEQAGEEAAGAAPAKGSACQRGELDEEKERSGANEEGSRSTEALVGQALRHRGARG